MNRTLCIWFPNWPIQRLLAARPEFKQQGIVLYTAAASQKQLVLACNQIAARLGVQREMPLSNATSLFSGERQTLHLEEHDPMADRLALEILAEQCEKFSPFVGLEESSIADCLLLNVTGLQTIFQGEENLARLVVEMFSQQNYFVQAAIADSVGAAWGAAHFLATANMPIVVPPQDIEMLRSLPLAALRLPHEMLNLFEQLGILQIGELLQLSRDSLKARFGPAVLERLHQFTGKQPELIKAYRAPFDFHESWHGEYAARSQEAIQHLVRLLLLRLTSTLETHQEGVIELSCQLTLEDAAPLKIAFGLYQPTIDAFHLEELLLLHLKKHLLAAPVIGILIKATRTAPLAWKQYELFGSRTHEQSQQLSLLVNRLSCRLGMKGVLRPQLRAEAVPEKACVYEPYLNEAQKNKRRLKISFAPFERPLHLHSLPIAIEIAEQNTIGPPQQFVFQRARYQLARHWGPERIEAAWWRGPAVRRDYYRVQTTSGERFWLFRRLQDSAWFVHGELA